LSQGYKSGALLHLFLLFWATINLLQKQQQANLAIGYHYPDNSSHAMATRPSSQISTNRTPGYISPPMPPIDETAIFYSGLDFTPLNSASITRVASMSPEMSSKAELDLNKHSSGQHARSNKRDTSESTFAPRHRAFSAPVEGVNLGLLNKKLETDFSARKSAPKSPANNQAMHKPTAQEWVADIDCVSDIFGAMLADGDRGSVHL
jgi:hypothetical protein